MERRLLLALPAGGLITAAIFIGLDFALRLPEPDARGGECGTCVDRRAPSESNQPSEPGAVERFPQEPVHPRDTPNPLSLEEIRSGPPTSRVFWDMTEPLPVETDTHHWRSAQCIGPADGGGGFATLEFVVGADGKTKDVRVFDSSSPELAQCAVEAAGKWRWRPVVVDGKAIESEGVRRLILFAGVNQTTDR